MMGLADLREQATTSLADLRVKLFADGADTPGMLAMYRSPHVKGFTTNPTLMRKAGVTDYRAFARDVLAAIRIGRSRSRSSPTTRPRWSARRARSPPGAPTSTSRSR
jgi:transaldolase